MSEEVASNPPPLTLPQALNFSPDDLEANREGRLSPMQDYRLRTRRRRSIALALLVLLLVAFIATLLIYLGTREGGSVILTLIGIGLTLGNAAMVGIFARYWLRLSADIRAGEADAIHGKLERVVKPVSRRVINYMIRVNEVELMVDKQTFQAFGHDEPYTIYRAPNTGLLLSAEQG